jgi:hypothetical protein
VILAKLLSLAAPSRPEPMTEFTVRWAPCWQSHWSKTNSQEPQHDDSVT